MIGTECTKLNLSVTLHDSELRLPYAAHQSGPNTGEFCKNPPDRATTEQRAFEPRGHYLSRCEITASTQHYLSTHPVKKKYFLNDQTFALVFASFYWIELLFMCRVNSLILNVDPTKCLRVFVLFLNIIPK